jgi:hypothetical protein
MTDDDIIRMAKEAGMTGEMSANVLEFLRNLLRAERERLADQIDRMPFGDTAASFSIWIRGQDRPAWDWPGREQL